MYQFLKVVRDTIFVLFIVRVCVCTCGGNDVAIIQSSRIEEHPPP